MGKGGCLEYPEKGSDTCAQSLQRGRTHCSLTTIVTPTRSRDKRDCTPRKRRDGPGASVRLLCQSE